MLHNHNNHLSHFCVAGINYRKSDLNIRSKFSLSQEQCEFLLKETIAKQIPGAFVLSTCNRTEIYGISHEPRQLAELLCLHTHGSVHDFIEYGYTRQALPAVEHLFKVSAGLDSQIIGDHEILSQLKQAVKCAREQGCINNFLDRLISFALQSSKEIKSNTHLSSGTVSVSYAAIEIIKEKIGDVAKKILLVGTGKIGSHIARNLKVYLPEYSLTFCNRTNDKALLLAQQFQSDFVPYDQLPAVADSFDIITVSANAEDFIITPGYFKTLKPRLILDLSVPQNVDPAVKMLQGTTLMNVDEISAIPDKTINSRKAEIPKALQIIDETIEEVIEWCGMQLHSSVLRRVKLQLNELSGKNGNEEENKEKIHQAVSSLAVKLRKQADKGCQCIHAMNDYLQMN